MTGNWTRFKPEKTPAIEFINHISAWKSKGLSSESINSLSAPNNSLCWY